MASIEDALAEAWQCFRRGDRQRAGTIALQILQLDAERAGALSLVGAIFLAQGKLAEAVHYCREALRRQPGDAACHNSLGVALARQGKFDEALPHFREVLRVTPGSAEAHNNLALILKDRGQAAEAGRLFREALRLDPGFRQVHNNLGLALMKQGKLDEALASLQHAVQLDPGTPEIHQNLGLVLKKQDKLSEAEACFRQAIRLRPGYADAHSSLGNLLREQERLEEAEASCRQALLLNPNSGEFHTNLGLVLKERDRLDEALVHLKQALALKPGSAEIYNNLGLLYHAKDQFREAVVNYRQALVLDPDYAEVHHNLGLTLQELGPLKEAEVSLQQAIRLKPDYVQAHNTLGVILQEQGNVKEAEAKFREALQIKPDHLGHNNLGVALVLQGKTEEAVEQFRQALAHKPDYVESHINLGNSLQELAPLEAAEASIKRALELQPDYPEAHHGLAFLALLKGDFELGWAKHEWRWRIKENRRTRREFRQPLWDGSDLTGRTILVYTEQGLGDNIHFIRYASLVKERGGTVVFESPPALVRLFGSCPGIDRIIPQGSELPDFDVQAPLMSLPWIFGTTLATVPAAVPYLSADADLIEQWRRELAPLSGFKVGIGWQGNPRYKRDRMRSIPLAFYEPLARVEGVRLFSLQKGAGREQLPDFAARFPVADLGERLDETTGAFMDTAAVLKNLDLVITSDTALPHLAGALGVPVWVGLGHVPEWRWMMERADSPWYPSMRLFRQSRWGDWQGVFERMAAELAQHCRHIS